MQYYIVHLVKCLVNRMAYDESIAWFRVQHYLKPVLKCPATELIKNFTFHVYSTVWLCLHMVWLFFSKDTWHHWFG